jgi:putative membrane protein
VITVLPLLALTAYGWGVARLLRRGNRWPASRTLCAVTGCALAAVSLSSPLLEAMDFRLHIVQHLLLGMLAPFALALSAPIILALRTLPGRPRTWLLRLAHSRLVRLSTAAPVVLSLDIGGMYAYYLTPLFAAAEATPWLHAAVHTHMFVVGCLLSWYLVGRDPLPGRRSTRSALVVLFIAAGSHDVLAKLMYAHLLPHGEATATQLQDGAQIMYYGGDVVELLLATCLLASWYARAGRALAHQRRRSAGTRAAATAPAVSRPARP